METKQKLLAFWILLLLLGIFGILGLLVTSLVKYVEQVKVGPIHDAGRSNVVELIPGGVSGTGGGVQSVESVPDGVDEDSDNHLCDLNLGNSPETRDEEKRMGIR